MCFSMVFGSVSTIEGQVKVNVKICLACGFIYIVSKSFAMYIFL